MNKAVKEERQKRVEIVNALIFEIASRGRCFFRKGDHIAKLFLQNGNVYYLREWVPDNKVVPSAIKITGGPDHVLFKGFWHGGTLKCLISEFANFILHGGEQDKRAGRHGLSSPHWGYDEADMIAIRNIAYKLGYLVF